MRTSARPFTALALPLAATLVLSVRTVERHLQNAYVRLGLQGRTARTAAVARLLAGS